MSGAHRAGGDRHLRKVCFTQLFLKEVPDWLPGEIFFTAFASVAVKTSHEMVLLSKQPISSAAVHCPSAELPSEQARGAGEGSAGRKARQSPHSQLASNSLSFFTSEAPLASRDCRCPAAVLPTALQSPRGPGAGGAGEPAVLLATSSGSSPSDGGWNSVVFKGSFKNHSVALWCPAFPSLLRLGLDVIGFKDRV